MKNWINLLKNYKNNIILINILFIVSASLEGMGFALFILLFYSLGIGTTTDLENIPVILQFILRPFESLDKFNKELIIFSIIFFIFLIKNIAFYSAQILNAKLRIKFRSDLREKVFNKYLNMPYKNIIEYSHGKLIHDLYESTHTISDGAFSIVSSIGKTFYILVIFLIMIFISLKLTLLIISISLILILIVKKIGIFAEKLNEINYNTSQDEMSFCSNILNGIRQVIIFRAKDRVMQYYTDLMKKRIKQILKPISLRLLMTPLVEILTICFISLLFIMLLSYDKETLRIQIPIIITFLGITARLNPLLNQISQDYINFKSSNKYVESILDIIHRPEPKQGDKNIFDKLKKSIIFENIDFSYKSGMPVLNNINISFSIKQTTAIVGHSGSGKSTIIDLLAGLFEPSGGRILINNLELKDINLDSWRKKIGYVTQDTFIFHGTIKENICFGKPEATDEEIIKSAEQANINKFIQELPDKYDTLVGERGLKLSGGQRQRLAIARALIVNPEVLIFDEATSSLDSHSEAAIQQAIKKLSQNRTIIIIAHRLSTILNADKIIVLDKGKVVDQDAHKKLLNRCKIYKELYTLQFKKSIEQENNGGLTKNNKP